MTLARISGRKKTIFQRRSTWKWAGGIAIFIKRHGRGGGIAHEDSAASRRGDAPGSALWPDDPGACRGCRAVAVPGTLSQRERVGVRGFEREREQEAERHEPSE